MYLKESVGRAVDAGGPALASLFGSLPTDLVELAPSGDSDRATAATIGLMTRAIRQDWRSLPVVLATAQAIAGAGTPYEKLAGIFRWVKTHVRYVHDDDLVRRIFGNEEKLDFLIDPARLITMPEPQGDCDDFAPLTAAMMVAAGFPVGLATVAHKAENPRMWTHVYAVTRIGGSTIGMDTAEGPGPGWEPPYFYRRCEWPVPIDLEAYRERLHGLGHFMQSGLLGLGKTDWGTLVHGVGTFIQGLQPGISGMGEIDWGSIVAGGFKTVGDITKARYGVPPSGTYIQTGPQGSTVIRPTPGTSSISLPGISNFSLSPTMLALLAIGLVALVMMGRR